MLISKQNFYLFFVILVKPNFSIETFSIFFYLFLPSLSKKRFAFYTLRILTEKTHPQKKKLKRLKG